MDTTTPRRRTTPREDHPAVHSAAGPGVVAFVGAATLFGFCWGWVAYRAGSIRWAVVSHVSLDFAGLGGRVYLP